MTKTITNTAADRPSPAHAPGVRVVPRTISGLLGWMHYPRYAATGVVIIVPPLGGEARSSHMPMRVLADRLAAAGALVLRYDHRGTGDSLPPADPDADLSEVWLEDVAALARYARSFANTGDIVLCGFRSGGALAVAAAERAKARGLILLAPTLSLRSWIRRLQMTAAVAHERGADSEGPAVDIDGLVLSQATATGLAAIDLAKSPPPTAPVFLAAQNKTIEGFGARIAEAGGEVEMQPFPGLAEMSLDSATSLQDAATFDAAARWFETRFTTVPDEPKAWLLPIPTPPVLETGAARETPVVFGAGLCGVICRPDTPRPGAPSLLILNSGGDPRSGVGGFSTRVARHLAELGYASLRFDFAGVGDSPYDGPLARAHVFETPRDADFDAALALLRAEGLAAPVVVGTCAGAFHAFWSAVTRRDIAGFYAVSPVKLIWSPGDVVTFGRGRYQRAFGDIVKSAFSPSAWRRVLTNGLDVKAVALTLGGRLRGRIEGLLRRLSPNAPIAQLRRFSQRGGRGRFLMGDLDTSLEEISTHFGSGGAGAAELPGVSLEVLPNLDHGLTLLENRNRALEDLETWLDGFA